MSNKHKFKSGDKVYYQNDVEGYKGIANVTKVNHKSLRVFALFYIRTQQREYVPVNLPDFWVESPNIKKMDKITLDEINWCQQF